MIDASSAVAKVSFWRSLRHLFLLHCLELDIHPSMTVRLLNLARSALAWQLSLAIPTSIQFWDEYRSGSAEFLLRWHLEIKSLSLAIISDMELAFDFKLKKWSPPFRLKQAFLLIDSFLSTIGDARLSSLLNGGYLTLFVHLSPMLSIGSMYYY